MSRTPRRLQAQSAAPRSRNPAVYPSHLVSLPEDAKLPLRVHLRLATCRNLLMREARRSVERWGLTLPQFDALAELSRAADSGFTFVELSRLLRVTSGNLTGIVDRLEIDGMVRRETDHRDRRLVRIVLTKKGRQLVEQIMPLHARDIQALLAFMSVDELATLHEMLGRLRDGVRDRSAPADGAGSSVPHATALPRSVTTRHARGSSRGTRRAAVTPRHSARRLRS